MQLTGQDRVAGGGVAVRRCIQRVLLMSVSVRPNELSFRASTQATVGVKTARGEPCGDYVSFNEEIL